jgi:DNA modification methylase
MNSFFNADDNECVVVDFDEMKEKAANAALNKAVGEWDEELLNELLLDLKDYEFDMNLFGFDTAEKKGIEEDNFDVDNEIKNMIVPFVQLGDTWKLGNHRLVCGDACNPGNVKNLMDGKLAHMVFTDPPYNVNYEGGTGLKIKNDSMEDSKFYRFLFDAYKSMFESTQPGGAIYVCHADSEGTNFRNALKDTGWELKQCIVWIKNSFVMGRQDHHWQHEPILYGWKPGKAHAWYGGRKESTVIKSDDGIFEVKTKSGIQLTVNIGLKKVVIEVPQYKVLMDGDDTETTTWYVDKPIKNGEHPTMKPIKLCARGINNSSKPGDIILDLFGGSGSTLMAAEQTGRACFTMELDERYASVIVKRYINYKESSDDVFLIKDGECIPYKEIKNDT